MADQHNQPYSQSTNGTTDPEVARARLEHANLIHPAPVPTEIIPSEVFPTEAFTSSEVQDEVTRISPGANFLRSLPIVKLEDLPENSQSCHICKELFDDPTLEEKSEVAVMLPCNHIMGSECLSNWFEGNNTCPMCRAILFHRAVSSGERQGAATLVWTVWPRQPSSEEQLEAVQALGVDSLALERLATESNEQLVRLHELQAASETEENRAEVSRILRRFEDIDASVEEIGVRVRRMRLQSGNAR